MAKGGKGGGGGGTTWRGGNGDDIAIVGSVEELATTTYDGRGGFDTLDMSALETGVTIKINNGPGSASILYPYREFTGLFYTMSLSDPEGKLTGTIKGIEHLIGGSGDDFLFIDSSGPKTIDGGPGDDALGANGGNATLIGGTGSDVMLIYGSNNVLVGGTYDHETGIATADGESDTFIIGTSATILDFEIGIDRLQIETNEGEVAAALNAVWQDTPDGAMLQAAGKTIILAGITAAEASAIQLQFTIGGSGYTQMSGGPGDDTFYAFNDAEDFVLDNGSGHDTIIFFDTSEDSLVFPDGGPDEWSVTYVNGEAALIGFYDGGNSSVTLVGLTPDDIDDLMIESTPVTVQSSAEPSSDWLFA